MTTTVFLVRHGSHDRLGKVLCGRMDGVTLNDAGRAETQALAARLAGEELSGVYASPLERTRETAAPIARACGLEVVQDEGLLEIDFGDWTGRAFDTLADDPDWRRWNEARGLARPPGGESMLEVQARLTGWFERVRQAHPRERIAAVSHADVIKAAVAYILGMNLDQHDRLEISPGSTTAVAAGAWGMKLLSLNEVPR